MHYLRNCYAYAFVQGFYERLLEGESAGRTNINDHAWNNWYDRGMNAADKLRSL